MPKFKRPNNPVSYLRGLVPQGSMGYFTRRGIGWLIRCPFCPHTPPSHFSGYHKWRWLTAHIAKMHHAKDEHLFVRVGATHGVEHSQERARPNGRAAAA